MQKVSEIVITVYATIFYVLTSKFGSLVPFSKMISQRLKINLLVVESIIFGFMFYIFFRIGYSILGLKFGHESFSVGSQNGDSCPDGQVRMVPNGRCMKLDQIMAKQQANRGIRRRGLQTQGR